MWKFQQSFVLFFFNKALLLHVKFLVIKKLFVQQTHRAIRSGLLCWSAYQIKTEFAYHQHQPKYCLSSICKLQLRHHHRQQYHLARCYDVFYKSTGNQTCGLWFLFGIKKTQLICVCANFFCSFPHPLPLPTTQLDVYFFGLITKLHSFARCWYA